MKPVSFQEVVNLIKEELKKKSIDSVYNNTHDYFNDGIFLYEKMIKHLHSAFKIGFLAEIFFVRSWESTWIDNFSRVEKARIAIKNNHRDGEALKLVEEYEHVKQRILSLSESYFETYEDLITGLKEIEGVGGSYIPVYEDEFLIDSFVTWMSKNLTKLKNYKIDQQKEIESFGVELNNNQSVKQETNKSLELEYSKRKSLITEIESIQEEIDSDDRRKANYEDQIRRNIQEIEKIKLTTEFQGKKAYEDRIKELEKENAHLPKSYEEYNIKLNQKFLEKKDFLFQCANRISVLEKELALLDEKYFQLQSKIDSLSTDKTDFNIDLETELYNSVYDLLIKNTDNKSFADLLFDSKIFEESFMLSQNIDLVQVKKSILKVVNSPIPSQTKNNYTQFFRKVGNQSYLALFPFKNSDAIAAIYFALSLGINHRNHSNILKSESGIIYINLGNGVVARSIIRENTDNINEDIVLLANRVRNNNIYHPWTDYIYNHKYIFCGYTESGYILNVGVYIVTKELIFEIYFQASALLINNNQIPMLQINSDSEKIADIDYQDNLLLYDD